MIVQAQLSVCESCPCMCHVTFISGTRACVYACYRSNQSKLTTFPFISSLKLLFSRASREPQSGSYSLSLFFLLLLSLVWHYITENKTFKDMNEHRKKACFPFTFTHAMDGDTFSRAIDTFRLKKNT